MIKNLVIENYPKRAVNSNKFDSGVVAVIGGSKGLTGAVCLASESAMRTGAGYVLAVVPDELNQIFEQKLLEVMTVPAPGSNAAFNLDSIETIISAVSRADAVAVGPGLGRAPESQEAARELVKRIEKPLLIDADGLNAIDGHLDQVAARVSPTVLTPHAGELARLAGHTSEVVNRSRLSNAKAVAKEANSIVVLKGNDTIIAHPDGRVAVNPGATEGLATAGSGDVLSGIVVALLSKGLDAFEAAALGVYLHSRAAISAADEIGPQAMIAGDVISQLPHVLPR